MPASSPCTMISAPISRVEAPQEVFHTWSRSPDAVWKVTSKARAKFCPRLWLVPGLQRLVVLHQRLAAVGAQRAGEPLAVGLPAGHDRHRHPLFHERAVDAEHPPRLFLRLRLGGVGGVALLPEELGGAEEEARAHLPADHVGPLVDQQRQVAVALDPLRVHRVDDRLRRRPDDQRLLQLLAAAVGDDRQLGREPLDVLRLPAQEALGDEEREIGVLVAGVLEHLVQRALHLLPDGVAVRPDDHAPAHRAVVRQLGLGYQLVVPGAEIGCPRGQRLRFRHP